MKAYKVKGLQVVEVECEELRYPLYDSDGDKIYTNKHFATREEAYKRAIEECEAGINLAASDIEIYRTKIRECEARLADYAIAKRRLQRELMEQAVSQ